jgi:endoplasmic reticulum Man9GlcNAc2 1,2-alpha-mannosidase
MSAYHLTGNELLLRKAEHVALPLAHCFLRTDAVPYANANLRERTCSGNPWASSVPAAVNLMVEWRALAAASANPIFDKALRAQELVVSRLQDFSSTGGLIASEVREHGFPAPAPNLLTTIGSPADSYYEYLLKSYVQGNMTEPRWRDYWLEVVDSVVEKIAVDVPGVGHVTRELLLGHLSRPAVVEHSENMRLTMDHFSWYDRKERKLPAR